MGNQDSQRSTSALPVYARDCGLALVVMGLVYLLCGETGLVFLVYGYSIAVVIFLFLSSALSQLGRGDDDDFVH